MNTHATPSVDDTDSVHGGVRQALLSSLRDQETVVISLSGPWGSGKTSAVERTIKEMSESGTHSFACASLFGLKSLSELKLVLLDDSMSRTGGLRGLLHEKTRGVRKELESLLSKAHTLGPMANELVLLRSGAALAEHIIVLDDIERKHDQLGIDEISGFIDELRMLHKCRFVLVMNDAKLIDEEKWQHIREKIVDREINLRPRPEQSLDVVFPVPDRLRAALAPLIVYCGITNIRAIKKIAAEARLAPADVPADSATMRDFLAPLVLFMSIHFRAQTAFPALERLEFDDAHHLISTPELEQAAKALGFSMDGPFTNLVARLMFDGHLPVERMRTLLQQEYSREDQHKLTQEIRQLRDRFDWYPEWPTEEAVTAARSCATRAAQYVNHALFDESLGLLGEVDASGALVASAISDYERRLPGNAESARISGWDADRLNTKLAKLLRERKLVDDLAEAGEPLEEYDVDLRYMQEIAIGGYSFGPSHMTTEWFLSQLQKLDSTQLRKTVTKLLQHGASRSLPVGHEEHARAFSDACKSMSQNASNARHARMLKLALEGERPRYEGWGQDDP